MEVENLFDKHNYVVVQNAISQELADFVKIIFNEKKSSGPNEIYKNYFTVHRVFRRLE